MRSVIVLGAGMVGTSAALQLQRHGWSVVLVDRKPPGPPSKLSDGHRAALARRLDEGPIAAIDGVVRWRLVDLIQWLWEEFRLAISKQTLSREMRALDYRKLSARPCHHQKNEAVVAAFKNISRPSWRRSARTRPAASP